MDLNQILISAAEAVQHAAETIQPIAESTKHMEEGSGGVLGTLGVNWKLFIAQLVNFGIVLFIFWKWIVKPVGKTLTERQERIESGLKNADLMEQEKKSFEQWKQEEMKKTRAEAEGLIKLATDTANKLKQEIATEAQKQATKTINQAKTQIEFEKQDMLKEVKQEVATLVVSAAEKILRHKLDTKQDQELITDAVKHVR